MPTEYGMKMINESLGKILGGYVRIKNGQGKYFYLPKMVWMNLESFKNKPETRLQQVYEFNGIREEMLPYYKTASMLMDISTQRLIEIADPDKKEKIESYNIWENVGEV